MKFSRTLGLALVAVLAVSTAAAAQVAPGGTFEDDNGSVHEGNIEAIAAEGITQGCNPPANTRFCPSDPVTRGQMAAFLVRAMGYTDNGGGDHFTDDDNSIYENAIDRLFTAGVTLGCNPPSNDRYCPDSTVTRGQMAAFLVRAMGYTDNGGGNLFTDDDNSIYENAIDRLRTARVTLGCNPPDNDHFCPDDEVTREQMASFLTRALGLTPIKPPPPSGDGCPGTIGAIIIDDNLEVPAGTTCTLNGTTVEGNVIVGSAATLVARDVSINGNIQSGGHASVTVNDGSMIGGDIQLESGSKAFVASSNVDGNIQMESNDGSITITNNVVGGDIQVNSNSGGVLISGNTVDGNLQCESNNPGPTGGSNTVMGNKEGQCSGL